MSIWSKLNPLGGITSKAGTSDKEKMTYYTTPWKYRTADGVWVGHGGDVWVYRQMDVAPMLWEDPDRQLAAGSPLATLLYEVGATSKDLGVGVRSLSKSREIHILALTWEEMAQPPDGTPEALSEFMESILQFAVPAKALVVGVKVWSSAGATAAGLLEQIKSMAKGAADRQLGEQGPGLDSYAADIKVITEIMRRNGAGRIPDRDVRRQMEAWYNHGRHTDPTVLATRDMLFIGDYDRIEMAVVESFNSPVMHAPHAPWAMSAQIHPAGASVVSVRGQIEPASISRNRIRRQERRLLSQMEEEAATGDLGRQENELALDLARQVEGFVLSGREPLISDCSIVFGRRVGPEVNETYIDELRNTYGIEVKPLEHRQMPTLEETLPASSKRVNPHVQDVSVAMLAHAGLQGFSNLGDPTGAYIGLVDPDYVPCYLNPLGAPAANREPGMLIAGDPGSGKALRLSTEIPTPSGWTTMGELEVGDQVLGRDGRPCKVRYLSPIDESLELYDIHLSDGQVIRACVDHQWVVASKRARRLPTNAKRVAAIENWEAAHRLADLLDEHARSVPATDLLTTGELQAFLDEHAPGHPWRSALGTVLRQEGCRSATKRVPVEWKAVRDPSGLVKKTPSTVYPVRAAIEACRDRWAAQTAPAWKKQSAQRVAVCDQLLSGSAVEGSDGVLGVTRTLLAAGLPSRASLNALSAQVGAAIAAAGVRGEPGMIEVSHPTHTGYSAEVERVGWPAREALRRLAARVRRQHEIRPSGEVEELVLTTADLLREGVRTVDGAANFAIRVAAPLELPEADLPLDPYVLGVWLGDGCSRHGTIASSTSEATADPETCRTDQEHLIERLNAAGFDAHPVPSAKDVVVSAPGLRARLREAGLLRNKHMPALYLRASKDQRLELLRGLMDSDGTVNADGACELTLCNARLANDALELIRSLGIKAAMTEGDAALTEDDPDRPGEKRRRVTGTRYRIHFTTAVQVFSLPRKARRLPTEVRATQQWLYITDITPAPTEPGRCIQVDSPDHTYLAAGFVPNHNTFLAQSIALQSALAGLQTIFINPKSDDTLEGLTDLVDGTVIRLSQVEREGGFFDPFRFCRDDEAGRQIAADILSQHILAVLGSRGVAGQGFTQEQEIAVISGLREAANAGATYAAQAIQMIPDEHVRDLIKAQASDPLFRLAIGFQPQENLATSRKLLLIEFDKPLDIPEKGTGSADYTRTQRLAVAAVQLVTRASMELLANSNGGVMIVDEAWMYLQSSAGLAAMQSFGRLGRSKNILPIFATQRVDDLLQEGVGMEGYLSRVFVMKLNEDREAAAALKLCKLEPTRERIEWLKNAGPRRGKDGQPDRGAMALHRDLEGRHSAVLIGPVPEAARLAFSTNPEDRAKRRAAAAARAAAERSGPQGP